MTYSVKSGDSLSIIARDVLGDINLWPQIAKLNNIASPYTIYPGQILQLPEKSNAVPATTTTASAPKTTSSVAANGNTSSSISFLGLGVGGLLLLGVLTGVVIYKSKNKKKAATPKPVKA